MLVALICYGYARAQQSGFEVASIKQTARPREPGRANLSFIGTSGKPVAIAGNRVTVVATLRVLIAAAYDIKDYQILSAPPLGEHDGIRRQCEDSRAEGVQAGTDSPHAAGLAGGPVSIESSHRPERAAGL